MPVDEARSLLHVVACCWHVAIASIALCLWFAVAVVPIIPVSGCITVFKSKIYKLDFLVN